MSVETTRTALPAYETSSLFNAHAPVPPQYRDTALALESPQSSVLASSSSHNEMLRASSSQRVEEVTTLPDQLNATWRVPSSYSSVPTNREVGKPWDVYQKELSSLQHGIALWDPRPVGALYDRVSIGDVGFINEGHFYRMFNAILPWNDPSNTRLGEPEPYPPLDLGPFPNTRSRTLAKGDYYSRNVSARDNSDNPQAQEPRE